MRSELARAPASRKSHAAAGSEAQRAHARPCNTRISRGHEERCVASSRARPCNTRISRGLGERCVASSRARPCNTRISRGRECAWAPVPNPATHMGPLPPGRRGSRVLKKVRSRGERWRNDSACLPATLLPCSPRGTLSKDGPWNRAGRTDLPCSKVIAVRTFFRTLSP
jgi:hypothetical protein